VDKIRNEFETECGNVVPNINEISALKYTTAVVYEVMRLYPIVPVNTKTAVNDDILPGDIHIPKGARVSWNVYGMGRSESIWGPTAKHFDPTRWLEAGVGSLQKASPFKWPVFQAGPRTCLGQAMATGQIVTVLCCLVQRFEFGVREGLSMTYDASTPTLRMKGSLMMKFKNRDSC
jgi:cytochrome P450